MSQRLEGKVALVTGGSTGIGRSIAKQLADAGAQVVITGRNEATLEESAAQHDNISYVVADVAKSGDVTKTIDAVKARHDKLDVVVNNAGIAPPAPLGDAEPGHVETLLAVNVGGVVDTTRQALPLLKASKGAVVNIASSVADRPLPEMSVYSSTKAAVVALTKAWAKELATDGIRVNAVSPGPIETPLFGKMELPEEKAEGMAEQIHQMVPLARFGQADEVAAAVTFLASDDASYVTGAQYLVDGGFGA